MIIQQIYYIITTTKYPLFYACFKTDKNAIKWARGTGKQPPQQLYEGVKGMCDLRLGIVTLETVDGDSIAFPPEPGNSVDEIIACLKRIRKSVQLWNKRGGRQGYLQFVDPFIP